MNSRLKWALTVSNEVEQPLARFAVQALDALAQPLDRLDQVVALCHEPIVLGLDLAQFFLGAQVDGAKPFAVAPQLLQIGLDLLDRRELCAGLDLGQRGNARRFDLQHVTDFALEVFEARRLAPSSRSSARRLGFA